MLDRAKLQEILKEYKKIFAQTQWPNEKYKWEAIQYFQANWDINATNFPEMLDKALSHTGNLLTSANYFPKRMITQFAHVVPEEVRAMFVELYDESKDLYARVDSFKNKSKALLTDYGEGAVNHYQVEKAILTYLWLRYPDKYYIYKLSEVKKVVKKVTKKVAEKLNSNYQFKQGAYKNNINNFMSFYNELSAELQKDDELKTLLNAQITAPYYPDPQLRTLTIDFSYFIANTWNQSNEDGEAANQDTVEPNYWFLNANPKIWDMASMPVGDIQNYTMYNENNNKRRIFQNFLDAQIGDMIIGYECSPVKQVVALLKIQDKKEEEKIYFQKVENFASPINFEALKSAPELQNMEFLSNPQGSLFKLTKEEYSFLLDLIREENPLPTTSANEKYTKDDFLQEVYLKEDKFHRLVRILKKKKNIILQGAPGVGKTYAAKRLAYAMMGEKDDERIAMIQFHQNYSYEDFMMGYKPVDDGFQLKYGVFYKFCQKAANHPDKDYFFIIDEINRGNTSKIFGELLMLIEADYREKKLILAYSDLSFSVPKNLHIIGMMNTADRSLAMIDYALRRRFSFFDMEPGFETEGFIKYQEKFANEKFNTLIEQIKELNRVIAQDKSLGKGFCIGHSYFCNAKECNDAWLEDVVDVDILPMLAEYWFDDNTKLEQWENILQDVLK